MIVIQGSDSNRTWFITVAKNRHTLRSVTRIRSTQVDVTSLPTSLSYLSALRVYRGRGLEADIFAILGPPHSRQVNSRQASLEVSSRAIDERRGIQLRAKDYSWA
jgi:hypothetical protein